MANEFKVRKGLVVNGSGSVILDVQGSQGQLFSVTDQLSGSLFSVNDISGVPVLEAFSDSTVKIGQYLSEAIVVSGSTARITGSIAMAGFSSGSVLFAGLGGSISQNNASLFWDNVNGRLGIGTNAPTSTLDIRGKVNIRTSGNCELDFTDGSSIVRVAVTSTVGYIATLSSQPFAFFTAATERARISTNGNLLVGITSDDGVNRLQISGSSRFIGDMVITGSGATSATYAFTVQNSNGANILRTRSDGAVYIESVGSVAQLFFSGNDAQIQRSTSGLNGLGMYGPANASHTLTISSFSSDNYGNGALSSLRFSGNFISSTGNTAFSYMLLNGTINQTGTSTSIIRGLYISPTITSASNFRAVEWNNNISGSTSWGLYGVGSAPNYLSGSLLIGTTTNTGERLQVTGTARISQALTASSAIISGSGTQRLTVVGSGSAQPLFTVQGSQGELFSIVDSLSGSLFSVNDQSGLPIMEVFSDNTTLVGNYLAPMLLTTARTSSAAGINTLYRLPTSSYDAVYIDYTIRSGSNARAGNFMAMWSGTSVNFTDNSITEFGTTSGFIFGAHISGSNMVVTGSSPTSGWTVKTIIKAI